MVRIVQKVIGEIVFSVCKINHNYYINTGMFAFARFYAKLALLILDTYHVD